MASQRQHVLNDQMTATTSQGPSTSGAFHTLWTPSLWSWSSFFHHRLFGLCKPWLVPYCRGEGAQGGSQPSPHRGMPTGTGAQLQAASGEKPGLTPKAEGAEQEAKKPCLSSQSAAGRAFQLAAPLGGGSKSAFNGNSSHFPQRSSRGSPAWLTAIRQHSGLCGWETLPAVSPPGCRASPERPGERDGEPW